MKIFLIILSIINKIKKTCAIIINAEENEKQRKRKKFNKNLLKKLILLNNSLYNQNKLSIKIIIIPY